MLIALGIGRRAPDGDARVAFPTRRAGRARAESPMHFRAAAAGWDGLSAFDILPALPWGVAPGWDELRRWRRHRPDFRSTLLETV